MYVECRLRRPKGTDVELARTIQFRPVDPTLADSPHVAEVSTEEAEQLFRADARVYVPFEAKAAAPLAPPQPPASAKPATPATPAQAAAVAAGDGNLDGEVSVSELRKMIADGPDKAALQALIDRENAKPEADRRRSFIDIATRALG